MHFTIYQIPPLLTGISTLGFGLLVVLKNKTSSLHRSFFLLSACVSIWQFGNIFAWAATSNATSVFWSKVLYIGVSFICAAFYHLSVEFNRLKAQKRFVGVAYLLSTALLFFIPRKDFIEGAYLTRWGRHIFVGPSHNLFLIFWSIPIILVLYNFYLGYSAATSSFERRRRRFVLVAYTLTYFALIDYLPSYRVPVPYPLGFAPLLFFIGSTAYAIAKYNILDITIVLKRVTVLTILSAIVATLTYLMPFYYQTRLTGYLGPQWILFPISMAFIIGIAFVRIVNIIRRLEHKELSKKFAYRDILRKEAERFSNVNSIQELLAYVARDLSLHLRLEYVGIMLWNETFRQFVLKRSFTRSPEVKKISVGLSLGEKNLFIQELLKKKKPLIHSELAYEIHALKAGLAEKDRLCEVMDQMHQVGAEITFPCFCEHRLLAMVNIRKKVGDGNDFDRDDLEMLSSLASSLARTIHGFMLKEEKIKLIVASQNILISTIEAKDKYTSGHTDRVARYAVSLGERLEKHMRGYPNGLSDLNWAAQLHDVGKISIPDSILLKTEPLTQSDWAVIREHPSNGLRIISPMREWLGEDICAGILDHHENFDGSGYPHRKRGDEIHLFAQIIRVADSFDAMATDRPYRKCFTIEQIKQELLRCQGREYNPDIVEVMMQVLAADGLVDIKNSP